MVEIYEQPRYHLKAYDSIIAMMKKNIIYFQYLAQSSVKLRQFSINPGIKGLNISLREKLSTDEMLPMKSTFK